MTAPTPQEVLPRFGDRVLAYLAEVDRAVESLSLHDEGYLARVPGWYLTHRRVTVGYDPVYGGGAVSIWPDNALATDVLEMVEVASIADYNRVLGGRGEMRGSLPEIASVANPGFTLGLGNAGQRLRIVHRCRGPHRRR